MNDVDAMVTGGTGFLGRWLLAELTRKRAVGAVVRNARSRERDLRGFVDRLGGDSTRLTLVEGDLDADALAIPPLESVRDVFHLGARFGFGLTREEARRSNVEGTLRVARWSASLPGLRRFVYAGGYRMTKPTGMSVERLYRARGAYAASKHESYRAIREFADEHRMPWTAVHPSAVIGDSRTGETTQAIGLADTIARLWEGRLPALVGTPRSFVPVVTVDYLARFMASVPERAETEGADLVVFDPATPPLHELVRRVAEHLHVRSPRVTVPVGLVRALPRALTGVDPEALSFVTEDTYDTRAADEHAAAMGLAHPGVDGAIARWCDHLVSTRFGAEPEAERGSLRNGTFVAGDPRTADTIYLHGLPWNGDVWIPVAARVRGTHARIDLPGIGRSGVNADPAWLERLLADRTRPVVLVGHSLGAAAALRYAHAHRRKVAAIVLVSPYFLQRPASRLLRVRPVVAWRLRRATPAALGKAIRCNASPALASTCRDLRRASVANTMARSIAGGSTREHRRELASMLEEIVVPVTVIHGASDPLAIPTRHRTHAIDGAGHDPQVTAPREVSVLIDACLSAGDYERVLAS
jgi:nucleoside-diphosphate-sugar epimerase/pimeloyl-ACP methyl ester carboxylesterase